MYTGKVSWISCFLDTGHGGLETTANGREEQYFLKQTGVAVWTFRYVRVPRDCAQVQAKSVKQEDLDGKMKKRDPLWKSFGYAFQGIGRTIARERNMKIHCLAAGLVVIFGCALKISTTEWFICLILFGLVMGLECVNTAVEATVDLVTEERRPLAKKAKDAAAGAVLVAAIFAAIIGCVIFLPKLAALF